MKYIYKYIVSLYKYKVNKIKTSNQFTLKIHLYLNLITSLLTFLERKGKLVGSCLEIYIF